MAKPAAEETDSRITKRRVTMASVQMGPDGEMQRHEAVDYVTPDFLEEYLTDARTRWQFVEVSEKPDAGPGGYDGQTFVPSGINHADAGTTRAATSTKDGK